MNYATFVVDLVVYTVKNLTYGEIDFIKNFKTAFSTIILYHVLHTIKIIFLLYKQSFGHHCLFMQSFVEL